MLIMKSVIIHINEYMKGHSLSQFQKDQYASYLESQLEKFSSFMLMQRKQNDKHRQIEEMIMQHQTSINQIMGKIELIEVYQHQNLHNCELMNKKINKFEGFQHQLQRIQDRCRISLGQEAKYTNNINENLLMSKQEVIKEIDNRMNKMQKSQNDLNKKLKAVEEEIDRNKDLIIGICKSKTYLQNEQVDNFANHKDLKKLQKKMHKYFDEKFAEIEEILKKNNRKRSKSPAYRTPVQFVNTYSSAQQTQKLLSEFKINETSNMKSQISTLSRQTKHTPAESRSVAEVFKKDKKQEKGRSKSKSKSRSKSRKYLDQSISRSKNDASAQKSVISKSKSPKPSKNLSKKSIQKSRQSSLSCKKKEKHKEMKGIPRKKSKKCPESCGTRYV